MTEPLFGAITVTVTPDEADLIAEALATYAERPRTKHPRMRIAETCRRWAGIAGGAA